MTTQLLHTALAALRQGKTLLYPTDTIWGIGCDAANTNAIERIYAIKQRDHSKSMLILANEQMLAPHIPSEVRQLLLHSPRPTTVILPVDMLAVPIADNLPAADGTVGVRIPQFFFCQQLLHALGSPPRQHLRQPLRLSFPRHLCRHRPRPETAYRPLPPRPSCLPPPTRRPQPHPPPQPRPLGHHPPSLTHIAPVAMLLLPRLYLITGNEPMGDRKKACVTSQG